jgi:sodium/bile acid cotransporter 7
MPTTVSSNVVMTGQAGGDEAAATCEVVFGNLVGTFLSPALLEMFFSSARWEFGRPDAGGGGGIGEVYRQVIQQVRRRLSLAISRKLR